MKRHEWTPNDDAFCRCGGIFSRRFRICLYCGAANTPDNRYEPGPHDYTPDVEVKPLDATA